MYLRRAMISSRTFCQVRVITSGSPKRICASFSISPMKVNFLCHYQGGSEKELEKCLQISEAGRKSQKDPRWSWARNEKSRLCL
jgi:hypothetical protein